MSENQHLVAALVRKRRDLATQLEQMQTAVHQMLIDLDHLDATLRLLDPDISLDRIKPKRQPAKYAAFDAAITPIVLEALREAEKPMTTHDLAIVVATQNDVDLNDQVMIRTITRRVSAALRHQRAKGVVHSVQEHGQFMHWEIAD